MGHEYYGREGRGEMKVAVNKCYGGFSLSKAAVIWLAERGFEPATKELNEIEATVKKLGTKDIDSLDVHSAQSWRDNTSEFMGYSWHHWNDDEPAFRSHPLVVECIETLGDKADGSCAAIEIVEVPDGIDFIIDEYDGLEQVAEAHRTW